MIDHTAKLSVGHQAKVPAAREIKISMDGKGAWRTIKNEEVCPQAYASVSEGRAEISRYRAFYNIRRLHSSLVGKSSDQACFNPPAPETVAA